MAEDPNAPERRKSPRPESTMALDFSSALDGAFNLSGDLPELHENVEQKKKAVDTQTQELQEIEARLKAAEDRLREAGMETGTTAVASGQKESTQQASRSTAAQDAAQSPTTSQPARPVPPSPGAAPSPRTSANPAVMRSSAAAAASPTSPLADRVPTPMDPSRRSSRPTS